MDLYTPATADRIGRTACLPAFYRPIRYDRIIAGYRGRAKLTQEDKDRAGATTPPKRTAPTIQNHSEEIGPTVRAGSLGAPEVVALQRKVGNAAVVQLLAGTPSSGGRGLPADLKEGIESLSGVDMSDVRVHYGSAKPAEVQARAYAQGTDIHLAPGQDQHLPHEAWHVAQQAQGRVQPTLQLEGGVAVNDDSALEHEADVMGDKARRS